MTVATSNSARPRSVRRLGPVACRRPSSQVSSLDSPLVRKTDNTKSSSEGSKTLGLTRGGTPVIWELLKMYLEMTSLGLGSTLMP